MCFIYVAESRIGMEFPAEFCQKIINTFGLLKKLFSRIVISDIHMIPVIEPRPLQHFVICRKSQRADQMQGRVRPGTCPPDIEIGRASWRERVWSAAVHVGQGRKGKMTEGARRT